MFNSTGVYEVFMKSYPRYVFFCVLLGQAGSYMIGYGIERRWVALNEGKLYKDVPYVMPPFDED